MGIRRDTLPESVRRKVEAKLRECEAHGRAQSANARAVSPKRSNRHKELVAACLQYMDLKGCLCTESDSGACFMGGRFVGRKSGLPTGWPDITGCTRWGIFIAVECKIGKDRVRPEQQELADAIVNRGGWHIICRDNIDALAKFFGDKKL